MGDRSEGGERNAGPSGREGTEWFEPLYRQAEGDPSRVPWAELQPKAPLLEWLDAHDEPGAGRRAVVVGCGLGDDAEEVARRGWRVTAFDLAPTAIEWCRRRFPVTEVDYQVADLFRLPAAWRGAFDLVIEVYTLQALPAEMRPEAIDRVAELVGRGGRLLLVCRLREVDEIVEGPPWPLTTKELTRLEEVGLTLLESVEVDGGSDPSVRRLRQVYRR